jgi:hypothetical protein
MPNLGCCATEKYIQHMYNVNHTSEAPNQLRRRVGNIFYFVFRKTRFQILARKSLFPQFLQAITITVPSSYLPIHY